MYIACALFDNGMCFQEIHDAMDGTYSDSIANVTHEFAPSRTKFTFLLYANISDRNTYTCEVKSLTLGRCFDSKPVMFHGKDTDVMNVYHMASLAGSYDWLKSSR